MSERRWPVDIGKRLLREAQEFMHPEEPRPEEERQSARIVPGEEGSQQQETDATPGEQERGRLHDLGMFIPRLLKLIGRLLVDSEIAAMEKVLLGAAVLYVVGPIDLIPDSIPVLGQLDDLYLLAICLLRLLNRSGPEKLQQYWDGPEDILKLLQEVTDLSTRFLPERVRGTIQKWVQART